MKNTTPREKINVADLAKNAKYPNMKNLQPDDWDTCKVISETKESFDGEKGMVEMELILQRNSDGKFFKVNYYDWGRGNSDILEQTAVEVFPKTETITVTTYV